MDMGLVGGRADWHRPLRTHPPNMIRTKGGGLHGATPCWFAPVSALTLFVASRRLKMSDEFLIVTAIFVCVMCGFSWYVNTHRD